MATVAQSADRVCPLLEDVDKGIAIDAIPIAHDVSRRLLPAVCLGELMGNPFGARMRGDTQPQKLTAAMLQDQESIQQPKRDRRDHKQIHRRNAVGMIANEGLPALRRWPPSPHHVLCYRSLSDIDAELKQLAMYPRCSPKRVRGTISCMSSRISAGVFCRPPRGRDFHRQ